jgi:hypothetical protein
MAMTRTMSIFLCGLLLSVVGCGDNNRHPTTDVDCSVADAYEFGPVPYSTFSGGDTGWFSYFDATPNATAPAKGNVMVTSLAAPGRCGDMTVAELTAAGHNFYGVGFGDYAHNPGPNGTPADATGYDGISFWARSSVTSTKSFVIYVDDAQTFIHQAVEGSGPEAITPGKDQDLDGDGFLSPGDIYQDTRCRIPPPETLGRAACYYGGALPPASPTRVPEPDECGNSFHTTITTTDQWQLFLLPWSQLVQFPCPNRLEGGIDPSAIEMIKIKFVQGTNYDVFVDNFEFYRLRADAGG